MVPQAVDFIFIVCTFKSFHTIVLYENTFCYTKLLDIFEKTGHAVVNRPLLFVVKGYGYQTEIKQEHVIVTVLYCQA